MFAYFYDFSSELWSDSVVICVFHFIRRTLRKYFMKSASTTHKIPSWYLNSKELSNIR